MTVREYIGARYVPVFSDPIQWDNTLSYEPLTVVMNLGTSYVSKQSVPAGIEITNETYWLRWADYNAQLEEYIRQVQQYNARIQENTDDITDLESAVETITANGWVTSDRIADGTVGTADIADNAVTSAKIADGAVGTADIADNAVTSAKIADGAVSTADIADNAVTSAKIANGAVGTVDIANNAITPAKLQKNKMVVIGDSWSYHEDGSAVPNMWDVQVAKALHLENHNYARGAVGYMRDKTNCFYDQLVQAGSELDANTVDRVYIFGGLNDVYRTEVNYQQFQNSVDATLQKAIELFPNSQIIVAGIQQYQCADVPSSGNASSYLGFAKIFLFTAVLSDRFSLFVKQGKFIPLINLGVFVPIFFQSNGHPSEAGHTNITSKMLGGNMHHNGDVCHVMNYSAGKPRLVANGTEYESDGGVVNYLGGNLHSLNFTFVLPNTDAWGSSNSAQLELRGLPNTSRYIRVLGVQTGTVITANPIWKNEAIQQAAANSLQFSKTYNLPIARASFKQNTIIEVCMYCSD